MKRIDPGFPYFTAELTWYCHNLLVFHCKKSFRCENGFSQNINRNYICNRSKAYRNVWGGFKKRYQKFQKLTGIAGNLQLTALKDHN